MKNYAISTIITGLCAIFSLVAVFVLRGIFRDCDDKFWENFALAIFGSSFLAAITSGISYRAEKRRTMDRFYCSTYHLLRVLKQYSTEWDDLTKLNFIINYYDIDKEPWGEEYGDIFFMFNHKKRMKYIYDSIYLPITLLDSRLSEEDIQSVFRAYRGKSSVEKFNLEMVISAFETIITTKANDVKKIVAQKVLTQSPRFVSSIKKELNGRYYDLMYSKNTQKGYDEEQS